MISSFDTCNRGRNRRNFFLKMFVFSIPHRPFSPEPLARFIITVSRLSSA